MERQLLDGRHLEVLKDDQIHPADSESEHLELNKISREKILEFSGYSKQYLIQLLD